MNHYLTIFDESLYVYDQQLWIFLILLGSSSTNQGSVSQPGYRRCGQKIRRTVEQPYRFQQTTLPDKGQQAEGQVSEGMSPSRCFNRFHHATYHNYSVLQYSNIILFFVQDVADYKTKGKVGSVSMPMPVPMGMMANCMAPKPMMKGNMDDEDDDDEEEDEEEDDDEYDDDE